MPQPSQQSLLPLMGEDYVLPSPKIKARHKLGKSAWSRAYAGFSQQFADGVLGQFDVKPSHKLVDPFVGSGTTAVAAANFGCHFVGVDLDPFSTLLTKAKTVEEVDEEKVFSLLRSKPRKRVNTYTLEALSSFSEANLEFAASVFGAVEKRLAATAFGLWQKLLEDKSGAFSSELVAITALLLAAKKCSTVTRGSNPVWFRQRGEPDLERNNLAVETTSLLNVMLSDIEKMPVRQQKIRIYNGDFSQAKIRPCHFDFMLTSPPYVNRLDYVVSHLPELILLREFVPFDLDQIKRKMMGTTKMVNADPEPAPAPYWGPTSLEMLREIGAHRTKASGTYYLKFYTQYFSDLHRFLAWSRKVMKQGAKGILVIQNSYYKELPIPVDEIIAQMANGLGFSASVIRSEEQRNHIGSMDPKQRSYVSNKVLQEKILSLGF